MTVAIDTLRRLLRYDAATGKLYWLERPREFFKRDRDGKRWNTRYAGAEAFSLNAQGYLDGMIFRQMHKAHHVAWALHHGEWPSSMIDHINGDRTDNRPGNLRQVTKSENCRNAKRSVMNRSGVTGVCAHKTGWRAYIRADGTHMHLGVFADFDAAVAARKSAERTHGYHPNHGREA